jgi:ribulose-5-phosphate 4-epimerase/fuculose-1-phosphate aldolase
MRAGDSPREWRDLMATIIETTPMSRLMPELTPEAEVALLARTLHREGFQESHLGHITYRQPDGTFLTTPFELAWNEVGPGDIMRMDAEGRTLEGRWSISNAITLHVALHRERRDVRVALHHHPKYATIWAARGEVPPAYDQTSAMIDGQDIAVMSEYEGGVSGEAAANANVKALGHKNSALLAHHGVFVVGQTISAAWLRARCLEWRCKQAWMVQAIGGGEPMNAEAERGFIEHTKEFLKSGSPVSWAAAVRQELRDDPELLTREGSWWGDTFAR